MYIPKKIACRMYVLWPLLISLGLFSCKKVSEGNSPISRAETSSAGIIFRAYYPLSNFRVTGTSWNRGDAIGVYVYSTYPQTMVAKNKQFQTHEDGGSAVFYPASASDRLQTIAIHSSIFAYYPYKNHIVEDKSFAWDIHDQSSPGQVDLLISSNLKDFESGTPLNLRFRHRLSRLVFTAEAEEEDATLNGLVVTTSGLPSSMTYHIPTDSFDGGDTSGEIRAHIMVSGRQAQVELYLFPMTAKGTEEVLFKSPGGKVYRWTIRAGRTFDPGKTYRFDKIRLKGVKEDVPIPSSGACMEIPSMKPGLPNTVFIYHEWRNDPQHRRNYSMLFDKEKHFAYWVAYPLHKCYLSGRVGRTDDWRFDDKISPDFQVNMSHGLGHGFDRGHQIPSADRQTDIALNSDTYYYTNMTPQCRNVNQGVWVVLENKVRSWQATIRDTLYVVTGASDISYGVRKPFPGVYYDIDGKRMPVPSYYYKVLAAKDRKGYWHTVGFRVPNDRTLSITRKDYKTFRTTVEEIERETGFKFFPNLPESVKTRIDKGWWE